MNLKTLTANQKGRDFFVGDIHGCFELLTHKLTEVDFDINKDRLISVGDLADRGPASEQCVELIGERWFHAVRGNHEDMCIRTHRNDWDPYNFTYNGGQWFMDLNGQFDRQERLVQMMETLPLFIQVPFGDKLIGVLHADALSPSWSDYNLDERETSPGNEDVIWGRLRISGGITRPVNDVDVVVVGHTPVKRPMVLGNVVYIDTGAVYGHDLTLIEAKDLLALVENQNAETKI